MEGHNMVRNKVFQFRLTEEEQSNYAQLAQYLNHNLGDLIRKQLNESINNIKSFDPLYGHSNITLLPEPIIPLNEQKLRKKPAIIRENSKKTSFTPRLKGDWKPK